MDAFVELLFIRLTSKTTRSYFFNVTAAAGRECLSGYITDAFGFTGAATGKNTGS